MPFAVLDDEVPQPVSGVLDGADDTDVPADVLGVERIGIGHVDVDVTLDAFAGPANRSRRRICKWTVTPSRCTIA